MTYWGVLFARDLPSMEDPKSIAKVYADANSKREKEYWDYEAYEFEWRYPSFVNGHVLLCIKFPK